MKALIVDCLGMGSTGKRVATVDVIGAGPRTIGGVLEQLGIDVEIKTGDIVLKDSRLDKFDVLMISAMSVDLPTARRVCEAWKHVDKGPCIIGGPIASDPYEALLKAGADVAVIGEGEKTLEELLDKGLMDGTLPSVEELKTIKGIAYRVGEEVFVNPLRPIMNRREWSRYRPSTRLIECYPNKSYARVYVEVVRGCSNYRRVRIALEDGRKCIDCGRCYEGPLSNRVECPLKIPPGCGYCSIPSLFGPSRSRPIEAIVEEIEGLIKRGVRRIVLSAPDFLDYGRDFLVEPEPLTDPREPPANVEAIDELLQTIFDLDYVKRGKAIVMIENIKPNLVNEEVAKVLGKYLHGTTVHIGCESGDRMHCLDIGRPSSPREVIRAVALLRRYGLRPYVYFIHGLPGQNKRTVKATIEVMKEVVKAGVEKLTVYRFQPLPMSAFANFPKAPPAHKDPLSSMIKEEAHKLNTYLRRRIFLGRELYAVVGSVRGTRVILYPVKHGPVVLADNLRNMPLREGDLVRVLITEVKDKRYVRGVIVRRMRWGESRSPYP
ncbi:MAG: B12-binding domain-containing radical SAM protein [Thermoprotei archaeon]|nr:MAG: B12-binding domain-containing radical SAM protein [Thermoprotei archaeon]